MGLLILILNQPVNSSEMIVSRLYNQEWALGWVTQPRDF